MAKDFIHLDMDASGALRWLNGVKRGVGDMSPLYKAIEPSMRKFAKTEFSSSNPNNWMELKPEYKAWKSSKGFSTNIGVMTGRMKWAASDGAKTTITQKTMIYELDNSKTRTKKGVDYSQYFDHYKDGSPKRKIFRWTALRVESFIQGLTVKFVNSEIGKAKR